MSSAFSSPFTIRLAATDLSEEIAALPAGAGIYVLSAAGKPAHLGWTQNLRRRLTRLLVPRIPAGNDLTAGLRQSIVSITCWPTASRLESSLLMYELAKAHHPREYLKQLRLRIPWFVGLGGDRAFPRLVVVNRNSRNRGLLYGPFSSRGMAERYQQEVLGLFQIRRCTEILRPSPDHPGCVYGEMKQCLRPCQCAVSQDEYADEAERVAQFLAENGRGLSMTLAAARERASENAEFEQAAEIHRRIERVNTAAAVRDEVIAEYQQFNGLALTRGCAPQQLRLWPIVAGFWQEPLMLDLVGEKQAKSLDQELRDRLPEALRNPRTGGNRLEDMAIFSRWYYSSSRDGKWFSFRTIADVPYRRLVREISKMATLPPTA